MPDKASLKCFVISPIGDDSTPDRKEMKEHANLVLEHFIKPALKDVVGLVQRADEISKSGDINRQVLDAIATYDLVVADLSYHNPNVFYELAIRHMLGKPYVQMMRKGERIPFDVGQQRTIFFDPRSIPELEGTRTLIRDFSEASLSDPNIDTPLGSALSIQSLNTGDPVQESLALILQGIEVLKAQASASTFEIPFNVLPAEPEALYALAPYRTLSDFNNDAIRTIQEVASISLPLPLNGAQSDEILRRVRRQYKLHRVKTKTHLIELVMGAFAEMFPDIIVKAPPEESEY